MQNGFIESFNGSFRDECLNEALFTSLAEPKMRIGAWKDDYNEHRPPSVAADSTKIWRRSRRSGQGRAVNFLRIAK